MTLKIFPVHHFKFVLYNKYSIFLCKFIPAVKYSLIDETCRFNHAKFLLWFVKEFIEGYIDVGDGCRRRNVLATTLRYCWRYWAFARNHHWKIVTNIEILSPTLKNCHYHKVINIHLSSTSMWPLLNCNKISTAVNNWFLEKTVHQDEKFLVHKFQADFSWPTEKVAV